jgi:hypothetical protein
MKRKPTIALASQMIRYIAVVLTLVAALIHAWVAPEHFGEWWGYGTFFVVAAIMQVVYGIALLRWDQPLLLIIGIVGTLMIIVLYMVTRTFGIPFFGPHAGEVEAVTVLDLTSKIAEAALIIALIVLLKTSPLKRGA